MRAIATVPAFWLFAVAVGAAEVTYIVTPPRLSLSYEALQNHVQKLSSCEVRSSSNCETTTIEVTGPIKTNSAVELLRVVGTRPGPITVRSDGRVAEVEWRTSGGATVEIYELEENEWKRRWSYEIPY